MLVLLCEDEITDNHAVIRVDRFMRRHCFCGDTSTRPNLIDSEQRIIVRTCVSPTTSRFRECVGQALPERTQCIIERRRIEVTSDDHMC